MDSPQPTLTPGQNSPSADRAARREQRRLERQKRRRVIVAGGVAGFALTLAVLFVVDRPGRRSPHDIELLAERAAKPAVVADAKPKRPVYRYSIVPGGVKSLEEVQAAMDRDPVVREHYATIQTASLRVTRLEKPIHAHVSYRILDAVYWTKKPVVLPAGEEVLTDGSAMIRTRCGNEISVEALGPALENEPDPPSFEIAIGALGPTGTPVTLDPPDDPGPPPPHYYTLPPPEQPTPVPEPSTLVLIGGGLAAGAVRYLRKRKLR